MAVHRHANIRDRSREASRELRRFVEDGLARREFRAGDKLPNERKLAVKFRTGRNTVRKTLVELEKEGKIERTVGRGTFVRPAPLVAAPLGVASVDGIGSDVVARSASPLDLMQFRLALEPDIAAYSVERAGSADIERMQTAIDTSRSVKSLQEFEDLDDELHRTIAASCRNPLFLAAATLITAVRTQAKWGGLKKCTLTDQLRGVHTAEHVIIVDAIRRRDAGAAHEAMRQHLVNVSNMMFPASPLTR
jgi:DNA-binding FadR family transcriptional regulator